MTSLLDPSHVHNNFPRAPSGLKKIQNVSPIVYSMNALLDLGKIECGAPRRQSCDWCLKERYIPISYQVLSIKEETPSAKGLSVASFNS